VPVPNSDLVDVPLVNDPSPVIKPAPLNPVKDSSMSILIYEGNVILTKHVFSRGVLTVNPN